MCKDVVIAVQNIFNFSHGNEHILDIIPKNKARSIMLLDNYLGGGKMESLIHIRVGVGLYFKRNPLSLEICSDSTTFLVISTDKKEIEKLLFLIKYHTHG